MPRPLALLVPLHLGDLHAYEQVLVAALAFGPFVVLAVVVAVVRRRDLAAEREAADAVDRADPPGEGPGAAPGPQRER